MNKHYKIYAEVLEDEALQQFDSVMALDTSIAGALMPDAHKGYSLPIGGVVATKNIIYPAWVGYDIGCGMCAAPLDGITKDDIQSNSDKIFNSIYKIVPVGYNHHNRAKFMFNLLDYDCSESFIERWENENPLVQLGTLGGGNHFIELGYDEDDNVWIVIHSGSRNFGWKTAQYYMKLASGDGKAREGSYGFDIESDNGLNYYDDMNVCLDFALKNRTSIMDGVLEAIGNAIGKKDVSIFDEFFINRNHNHAEIKRNTYYGDVIIHRKGATHAEEGMMGVIPGNMRDGSFIVCGKGNKDSLWSSSHGAGRVMGRKVAKNTISLEDFSQVMLGIQAKVCADTLDESPFAYKNIFDVMDLQRDLVEVIHYIKPIINVKG